MNGQRSNDEAAGSDTTVAERRAILKAAAVGVVGGVAAAASTTHAQEPTAGSPRIAAASFDQAHEPKPLPFETSSLDGISAAVIESHWSNNYGGSVRALNETKRRLAEALADDDLPPYVYNGLKREHLMRTGSVVLHELYFDNLGGSGQPDADVRAVLGAAYGEFDTWEREFRRIAAGLGGGSGWVVLGYNRQFETLENYWLADHMHNPVSTEPLLVIDMYEHSYHMDYGAATARYIDAFFRNINWEMVLARLESVV